MKYFGKKDYWRPNNLFDSIFLGISLSVLANMASGFETSPLFLFSLFFVIIAVVLTILYLYHKNNVATDIENELHRTLKGMAERDSAPRDNGQTVDKSESDSHEIKETESHISPIEYANK